MQGSKNTTSLQPDVDRAGAFLRQTFLSMGATLVLAAAVPGLLWHVQEVVAARSVVRALDVAASRLHTSIKGALVTVSGSLAMRSGELHLDPATNEPKSVHVVFEPQSFKADTPAHAQVANALMQAMPQAPVSFASSEIVRIGAGRYRVSGRSRWGDRAYDLSFVAEAIRGAAAEPTGAAVSQFKVSMGGPIELFSTRTGSLGALANAQPTEGRLTADLVFKERAETDLPLSGSGTRSSQLPPAAQASRPEARDTDAPTTPVPERAGPGGLDESRVGVGRPSERRAVEAKSDGSY